MKIALVHFTAAPIVGGVERVMAGHAQLFAGHGHVATQLCQRGGGAEALHFPAEDSIEALAAALRPVLAAQEVVFLHNVLTMPFHGALTEALWRLMDELPRVRFVAWVHDVAACNPDYAPVARIFSEAHARCEYVAVSPLRARQFAEAAGVAAGCCAVIPNGIDPARVLGLSENVTRLAQRRGLLDGRILLLHPARLVGRKNVELSAAVAREFARRGTRATVIVTAADDPHNASAHALRAELRSKCDTESCVILGGDSAGGGDSFGVSEDDLAALYRLADGLLFPSWSEGFGLPVLEAALHRLPVFCSDLEPLRDLAGETAVLFSPAADPARVADLIEHTLEASPAFRERRRVLRECSWQAIGPRLLALLAPR